MGYRNDGDALIQRLAALEHRVKRTEQLEQRVRELEQENSRLREALDRAPASSQSTPPATKGSNARIYVDPKVRAYAAGILSATRAPQGNLGDVPLADYLLSGARAHDCDLVVEAARARAVETGRAYVTPQDVARVAPDLLGGRVILSQRAAEDGVTAEAFIKRILELVEVP